MPDNHALLSASSASRWMVCTAAPRFEAQFPETTSEYAEEGRLAHSICELKVLKKFTPMGPKAYATRLNKLKKEPLYSEEMDRTSDLSLDEESIRRHLIARLKHQAIALDQVIDRQLSHCPITPDAALDERSLRLQCLEGILIPVLRERRDECCQEHRNEDPYGLIPCDLPQYSKHYVYQKRNAQDLDDRVIEIAPILLPESFNMLFRYTIITGLIE